MEGACSLDKVARQQHRRRQHVQKDDVNTQYRTASTCTPRTCPWLQARSVAIKVALAKLGKYTEVRLVARGSSF